jgi:hypothetical protein
MKLSALATLVSSALALTACGDDKDPTDDTTGSPTSDPTGNPTGNTMTDATTTDAMTTDGTTTANPTTTTDPTMTDPTMTAPTTSDGTTTADPTGDGPSFATDVWDPIFSPSCSCHQLGSSGGLMMGSDAAAAYASMVGVPSTGSPLSYVEAGSADASYIYHKVNNTHIEAGGAGSRMPLGGQLTPDQIATVKDWIDGGALP